MIGIGLGLSLRASGSGGYSAAVRIFGDFYAGSTIYSTGDFGWSITGGPAWPGVVLSSTANTEWKINGVGTGQFGATFLAPDTVLAGDTLQRGGSNILTSIMGSISGSNVWSGQLRTSRGDPGWLVTGSTVWPGGILAAET